MVTTTTNTGSIEVRLHSEAGHYWCDWRDKVKSCVWLIDQAACFLIPSSKMTPWIRSPISLAPLSALHRFCADMVSL